MVLLTTLQVLLTTQIKYFGEYDNEYKIIIRFNF